jgi:hypothetical protein
MCRTFCPWFARALFVYSSTMSIIEKVVSGFEGEWRRRQGVQTRTPSPAEKRLDQSGPVHHDIDLLREQVFLICIHHNAMLSCEKGQSLRSTTKEENWRVLSVTFRGALAVLNVI